MFATKSISTLLLVFGLVLGSASCAEEPAHEARRTILKFGTLIEVTLYDVEPILAQQALDQIEANFNQYHADWTSWQESPLTRLNDQLVAGEVAQVPSSILPLIEQSQILSQRSQGLFNPGINQLIRLWQIHRRDDPDIHPPTPQAIDEWLQKNPGMDDLTLEGSQLRSRNNALELNFGAFAKGYAIDLGLDYLDSLGIKNAVINAGGDLSVRGRHGNRAWKIGIRHPRQEGIIAWLEAQDHESIFTSGDYERFYLYKGKRYHHILDPRTGYPAQGATSVTVIHADAGTADAAATALFVAGPEQWQAIARSMGIEYVMLIDVEGKIHMSPKMAQRIHFTEDRTDHIVISESL